MKKKQDPIAWIVYLFIVVIVLFMGSIMLRMFTKNILVEKIGMNNTFTKFVLDGMSTADVLDEATGEFYTNINWEAMYPFQEEAKDSVEAATYENNSLINNLLAKINWLEYVVEQYCNEYLAGRVSFVEKAYSYEKIMGWSLIPFGSDDGIIIGDDGYLTYAMDKVDVTSMAQHVSDLHDFLEERDIPLLYIQAPSKVDPISPDLPAGVSDFSNDNMDRLLEALKEKGVDYLDLRNYILENYEVYEDAFYKTDHHWKTTTAFGAVSYLTDYLNEKYGYEFSNGLYEKANYHIALYEKYFLGSQGKKVTLSVVEPEDYELVEPLLETDFTIKIPERSIDTRGTFGETLLDYRHLQNIDYYGENCYASFMNRNDAYAQIINNAPICNKDKKILMIKDSYSTPFIPYLALGVGEIDTVYEMLFTGSIQTYIEQEQPDLVIVMYSSTSLNGNADSHSAFFNLE